MSLRYTPALLAALLILLAPSAFAQTAFINEIHYDDVDVDEGEGIEIAVPTGTDVAALTVTLYNGSATSGAPYGDPLAGSAFTAGATVGGYRLYSVTLPPNAIQNGSPDGLALSGPGGLIQFLSYEGTFTAVGGPADGQTSTDIGVAEDNATLAGQSLQLTGSGSAYADFTWTAPATATFGAANNGQTFGGAPSGPRVSFTTSGETADEGATVTLTLQITYGSGGPDGQDVTATVAFDGANSTAQPADFTGPTPATVTFSGDAEGETRTVTVALATGDGAEGSETAAFGLSVSGGSATVGSPATFTVTINDTADLPFSSIAQARAAGAGARVRVQGTVTRSKGAFTYFQDDTAGLAIRQAGDAPRIANVAPGTAITVTGTLSEFNGLLQINGDDLEEALVATAAGPVPAAQTVTLAQLAASGETYESELVVVRGATFAAAGGTFAAGTNYVVSDASATSEDVQVRVTSADDTDVDGLAIPAGPSDVTGVVGQFDRDDPRDGGYQLQPIQATDVSQGTAGEDGPDGGLSLAVTNPIRGAAAVEFTLATPGRAVLALYDALGRRVAVLADGAFGTGAQTATVDASRLASGVYVLRLQGEAAGLSRTVTVLR